MNSVPSPAKQLQERPFGSKNAENCHSHQDGCEVILGPIWNKIGEDIRRQTPTSLRIDYLRVLEIIHELVIHEVPL